MNKVFEDFINNINFFDVSVSLIFVYFIVQCFLKGFSLSLISFMKWVLSTVVTIILVPKLQPTVSDYIESEFVNNIGLGIVIFIFTLFLTIVLGKAFGRAVTWTGVGSIDKSFGVLFGVFKVNGVKINGDRFYYNLTEVNVIDELIDRIVIEGAYQNKGLGKIFYEDLIAFSKSNASKRIACEVNIKPLNDRSIIFHDSLGFKEVGQQDTNQGEKRVSLMALDIKPGEVHAIMGPNGSGKSTLANILSGKNGYEVSGNLKYEGKNLQDIPIEERAQKGIFLAFQYPLEIPGVNTTNFLKTSLNTIRKAKGEKELDTLTLLKLIKEKASELNIDEKFLSRQLNVGFSGGEKKKNEILQMKLLEPKLAILDETDSGLDIDALRIVADGVNSHKNKNNAFLIITHYQRLLDYIKPDFIHVLSNGKIIKTGSADLGQELEKTGYENLK